jgi:benzoyl-CoA-dihydrodiol lyase
MPQCSGIGADVNRIPLDTHPDAYRHWRLDVAEPVAVLRLETDRDGGFKPGYELEDNRFDLGVDIELADAIQRIRFEHPEVRTLVLTSGRDDIFCAGTSIPMLRQSDTSFRVNFRRFTNETRLALEDIHAVSDVRTIAALNGTAAGGGYALALACEWIMLRDDGRSAVAFPEVTQLGILPAAGGLTRLIDKRKVRRDLADTFATRAAGLKGQEALAWNLVDEVVPADGFDDIVTARAWNFAAEMAATRPDRDRPGVTLRPIEPALTETTARYRHVEVKLDPKARVGEITIQAPDMDMAAAPEEIRAAGSNWPPLAIFRELDHALVQLRFSYQDIGVLVIRTAGDPENVLRMDRVLREYQGDWFVREVRHFIKRTLKRLDVTPRSVFALIEPGSCFVGTFLEFALAADRSYMRSDGENPPGLQISPMNEWAYPMGNGLSRMSARFAADPDHYDRVIAMQDPIDPAGAEDLGLVTLVLEGDHWDDAIGAAIGVRTSISPDALTGLEANLRLAGPETIETRSFGRLAAWQNWILERPNASGKRGTLARHDSSEQPSIDWNRT